MKTIWKYLINEGENKIQMPKDCEVLSTGFDTTGSMCIWVEVDTDEELIEYTILALRTGYSIPEEAEDEIYDFIGTLIYNHHAHHIYFIDKYFDDDEEDI